MEAPAPPPPPKQSPGPAFPTLEVLDRNKPHAFAKPAKRINEGPDVEKFLTSRAYRDIGVFIMQLNRAMCPRKVTTTTTTGTGAARREVARTWTLDALAESSLPQPVKGLRELLRRVEGFIEEAPPKEGPRRFGNVSCRTWHAILAERADKLMEEFIPAEVLDFPGGERESRTEGAKDGEGAGDGKAEDEAGEKKVGSRDEIRDYLLGSFGSSQRLDYGTGHELCFLAFLGCLWKLGMFREEKQGGEIERSIILGVLEPYLKVVRRLILTYNLEPAGSHGVWGLDDHAFLPYIFGSAQLTRPITDEEPMPLEGSVRGAPKTGDVVKAEVVERERERNLYFSAIGFINDVKKGPFWEHSPILYDVSGVQDGWGKINKGMIKMFNAEVLSKFPVVQHFHFGSLFSFDHDPEATVPAQSVHMANQPLGPTTATGMPSATGMPAPPPTLGVAPWAQAAGMPRPTGPGIPYSRVPPPGVGTQRPGVHRGPPRDPRGGP